MVEVLLGIIAAELGLLMIGLSSRLIMEGVLIRATLKARTSNNGLPPGFTAITEEEAKAMGLDLSKLNKDKDKESHGQYV